MEMTVGTVLFYGGLIGLVGSVIMLVVVILVLKNKKKKLKETLKENY